MKVSEAAEEIQDTKTQPIFLALDTEIRDISQGVGDLWKLKIVLLAAAKEQGPQPHKDLILLTI